MSVEPDGERAQATQSEIAVVRPRSRAQLLEDAAHRLDMGLGGGDRAQHRVRMADDVLGAGLDRDIRPQRERLAEERRGPGVVDDQHRTALVSGGGECRKILDLEGDRARRFADHHAGVGAHQLRDADADAGVVEGGLDSHALEQPASRGSASGRRRCRSSARGRRSSRRRAVPPRSPPCRSRRGRCGSPAPARRWNPAAGRSSACRSGRNRSCRIRAGRTSLPSAPPPTHAGSSRRDRQAD